MCKLSICIPTYNGGEKLKNNIEMIINQILKSDIKDVELIISDNCSEDNTQEIISDYVKKYPKIITYNRNNINLQFNGNIKKLIKLAKGKYIHLLGDDDFYLENGIQRILNVINADNTYSVIMASNNWFLEQAQKFASREENMIYSGGGVEPLLREDFGNFTKKKFIENMAYRMYCCSCIILNRQYLSDNLINNLPNINNWIHVLLTLFLAFKHEHYYCFNDFEPILSVRLQCQTWLNNEKAPLIYLDNLRTYMYTHNIGYDKEIVNICKDIFLKYAPAQYLSYKNLYMNAPLIIEYFKYLYDKKMFYKKILPRLLHIY